MMAVAVTRDNLMTGEARVLTSELLAPLTRVLGWELGCVTSAPVQRQVLTDAARLWTGTRVSSPTSRVNIWQQ